MNVNFQYTPFDRPNEQIRLLTVHAGLSDSPLQCTLAIVPLKPHPPPYVAISYTWGPPTPTTSITIDGQPMVVRQSCADALRTMRLHRVNIPLWIDAICINQTDLYEKSFQVGLMGTIYSSAVSVAACLRCGDSLAMMRNLYPLIPPILDAGYDQEVFERWQEAVYAVMGNAYFTRMWIVQEIGLAKDLRLYSGEDVLDWTKFATQSYDWRGKMMSLRRYPTGPDLERKLKELSDTRTEMGTHQIYAHQKQDQTLTLTGLLSRHIERGCENPRDKIYAMLPMLEHASGFDSHHIQPDYGKSPWEVLWAYVSTIRFPAESERRKNSISTGFELWTGLRTFEGLVDCFKVAPSNIASFFEARRSRTEEQPFQPQTPHQLNYIETHFLGYAMRISCINSSTYGLLMRGNDAITRLPHSRHFLAVWPGLPTAAFTVEQGSVSNDSEAFNITGYYPGHGEVPALRQLPEKCDCRYSFCPAKRSKRDICKFVLVVFRHGLHMPGSTRLNFLAYPPDVHPEDLLAMVFLAQNSPNKAIEGFTATHTRSFIRMWEPAQQVKQKPSQERGISVSTMLAGIGQSIRRRW
ncbi:Heterokaryon incompatibility protein 6, OR allele [Madurella mycetomatis]|uniref:Heterokaryon incompatibility protein 6, OR allele n=1 Tax=Madurella mycetomatis TaxID=100816 RepID=A0A175WAB6_9PEZI|nr:Heterokaryon incompatibility protein 6, OR allele [Madurella mycetomatis]